ncbi:MAG: metallophosphoesterase family protein [Spirochaetes bacterium]|nr:metallophosphoesterase family protein [Spirochaetota bacterium]
MKIGVISDTHISANNGNNYSITRNVITPESLCSSLVPYFSDVKAILHAGDITDISLIDSLNKFATVYAVAGNSDSETIHRQLGEEKVIELRGFKIGLIHGWGGVEGLSYKVRRRFDDVNPDCIVFGHSHYPYDRIEDDVLMFNPGSPTEKRHAQSRSIGILHIDDNAIWGEHIFLD